ncbi:MAG: dockerin type I repeat-containing protein [Oscillospiraceae bacterium]|nr:dockerin type I repeat-containing protein [Oscillospiraceae bacterium]
MKQQLRSLAAATAFAVLLNMPAYAAATKKTYLSQIGSCKRIEGLHEYYEKHGRTLGDDTQFYYNTENGRMYVISPAGNAGIELTLNGPDDMRYEPLKGHIAALCAQYFGSGYQISEQILQVCIAIRDDGTVPDLIASPVRYEIRLPEQGEGVQEKAEALYRTLAGEQYPVTACMYYPEFGYVDDAIPGGYTYHAEQEKAISAYLNEHEPDWVLKTDKSRENMTIVRQTAATQTENSSDYAGAVYAKVFEALDYWPDVMAITDGCSRAFGIDLKQTVQVTEQTCPWESPYEKESSGASAYPNAKFFLSKDAGKTGTLEYYTSGSRMLSFRAWSNCVAFNLRDSSAVSYDELRALAKKYSDSYSVKMQSDFCIISFSGSNTFKPESADAIKKELSDAGLIRTFYGPGDVASVGYDDIEPAEDGSLLYYTGYTEQEAQQVDVMKAWLEKYRTDCTTEDYITPAAAQGGRTEPQYLKVTPKTNLTADQRLALACDIYRVAEIWPQWMEMLPHEPVYAVRNNSFVPAEPKGEFCEWIDTGLKGSEQEKRWSSYTKYDTKGMFGGDAYISPDGSQLVVFDPMFNAVGCFAADSSSAFTKIEETAKPYSAVSAKNGFVLIGDFGERDFPQEDVQKLRNELKKQGLISAFYAPGDVAYVSSATFNTGDALYYFKPEQNPDQFITELKAWLAKKRPGYTVTEERPQDLLRTDTDYIKVTPDKALTAAELIALATELSEAAGHAPLFRELVTDEPVYAVRNDSLLSAEPESKGEPCKWIDTAFLGNDSPNKWSNYTKFDSKGYYGKEVYISPDGSQLLAFGPQNNIIACTSDHVNSPLSSVATRIGNLLPDYSVSIEEERLLLISTPSGKEISQEEATRIRSILLDEGLIWSFYQPGEVAAVTSISHYKEGALYYYNSPAKKGESLEKIKAFLEGHHPDCSAAVTDGSEADRMDTSYIKVTAAEGTSDAGLFALAAEIYETTGLYPLMNVPQPVKPDYAVRCDSLSVKGDMNLDGQTDVADAVMLARYMAEDREVVIMDKGMKNADVQHDGQVDSDDLTLLMKAIAKQITL